MCLGGDCDSRVGGGGNFDGCDCSGGSFDGRVRSGGFAGATGACGGDISTTSDTDGFGGDAADAPHYYLYPLLQHLYSSYSLFVLLHELYS